MPGIYIASKVKHAARWRDYRTKGSPIISTWIDEAELGQTASFAELWERIRKEVAGAAKLVLHHEEGEILKGALIEVGIALQAGVTVVVDAPQLAPLGTWWAHPLCKWIPPEALEHALEVGGA